MLKDNLIIYILSGTAGVIIRDIYSLLANKIGLAEHYIWHLGAAIFVEEKFLHSFSGNVLGALVDLSIGAMLGVAIGLLIEWFDSEYYILLGWGIGLVAWLFFFGVLQHTLPHTEPIAPLDPLSNISSFVEHSIFGIMSAWTCMKLK